MSFDELYDSCFRNVSLVKVPSPSIKGKESDPSLLVTLDHVMSCSQHVVFLLAGVHSSAYGPRGADLVQSLDAMIQKKSSEKEGREKAQSSPARIRRFFGIKKKKKTREALADQVAVSVVVVETESGLNEENSPNFAQPGWYIFAPQSATTKSRLLRALGFEVAPSLTVVDSTSRLVVTTEGRRLLNDDPNGDQFPWWPPSADSVLCGPVVFHGESGGEKKIIEWKDLNKKVRALFFGASWCPPCRQWTKQLLPVYESLQKHDISVEIIFCSSDRSQQFYDEFTASMPWGSFQYDPTHTLLLTRLFNISGIPSLILIDEDSHVLTRHGRQALVGDPKGSLFPWGARPFYELNELSVCRLRDEPSLILFSEGSPEDIRFSLSVLEKISKQLFDERLQWIRSREQDAKERNDENGNSSSGASTPQLRPSSSQEECSSVDSDVVFPPQADPLQIFYTGDDPICDHILERILGLGDAELPLICIVDALGGRVSVCTDPDVSEEVLTRFVESYRTGKLEWSQLPSSAEQGTRTVGGIPLREIEKALMGNSPSQNSIGEKQTV